jgi:hypothetical protein
MSLLYIFNSNWAVSPVAWTRQRLRSTNAVGLLTWQWMHFPGYWAGSLCGTWGGNYMSCGTWHHVNLLSFGWNIFLYLQSLWYMEGINLFEQDSFLVYCSWDGVSVVTRLEAGWSRVRIMVGPRNLFIPPKTKAKLALGPTLPSARWVLSTFFLSLQG